VVLASEYLTFAFNCQQVLVKEIIYFKFFFPVLYKFQKSIFFSCTLVVFAQGGFGTAAVETEAVWLI